MQKIITIKEKKAIIDVNCLTVREFKELYEDFLAKDQEDKAIECFTWLHFMYDPESPYLGVAEEEREVKINRDFKYLNIPEMKRNHLFLRAEDKMKVLSETPVSRLLLGLKVSMDKISNYLISEDIVAGKDGNLSEILRLHQQSGVILKNFNSIEADFKKEVSKNRGNTRNAVDEDDTEDSF